MIEEATTEKYYVYLVVDVGQGIEVFGQSNMLYTLRGHPKTGEPLPAFRSEEDASDFLRAAGIDAAAILRMEVAY